MYPLGARDCPDVRLTSLEATNLLSFANTTTVRLSPGAPVFVVGANGSGKSNVLRLVEIYRTWVVGGYFRRRSYVLPSEYRFDPAQDASLGVTFLATKPSRQLLSAFESEVGSGPLTVAINLTFTAQATRLVVSTPTLRPDGGDALATVVLRADDGLLATTRFLFAVDDRPFKEAHPRLVPRAQAEAFPAITLLRVVDELRRNVDPLQAINELMRDFFGTEFVIQGDELLHQSPGGPARPLELASDGIIHALLLFYALSAKAHTFFFDEPASKLHPSLHNTLRQKLSKLAGSDKSVFVITHAPSMVDPEVDTLVHFSATPNAGTRVQALRMVQNQIGHLRTVVGRAHLFCRFVVLMEGKLDFAFLSALQHVAPPTTELGRILHSVHLTPVFGEGNLATAMAPFRCIPTPWICLCDADCLDGVTRSGQRDNTLDNIRARELQLMDLVSESELKQCPCISRFLKTLPTVRYDGDMQTARSTLFRELKDRLNAIQDHSEVQQVLRAFAKERLRTYVWASRGNGALEAALGIHKGMARKGGAAFWESLAREVLAAWEGRSEREAKDEKFCDVIGFLEYLVRKWSEPFTWWEVRHPPQPGTGL